MSSDPFGFKPSASAERPAIRIDNVSKHYVMFERPEDRFKQMVVPRLQRLVARPPKRYFRDFAALNGISLEVGRGETVGIIGRNGSGKSTLLQIICGTLQPTSGTVEVNGRVAALLELGAGFNPEFTGRENVFLNGQILGVPRKEMEWRFDDIARFADIGSFIDQPVKTYSSGMYVRLAFATAINVDPDILVVDEALAVGDEAFQRKCFARIEDIKDKGGTILFVSHGAQTIVQLCSRAVLIDGGEKILEGRPKTVVGQYQRLVNASVQGASEIRRMILAQADSDADAAAVGDVAMIDSRDEHDKAVSETGEDMQSMMLPSAAAENARRNSSEQFDPNMRSQSMVSLEERGAIISNPRLLSLAEEQLNVLAMGKRYIFEYQVTFTRDATGVGFGFWIKTVTGLGLAGSQTIKSKLHQTPQVRAGDTVLVRIEFTCLTLPGTYFVNCGVIGTVDGEQVVMHRLIDALMWKTANEEGLTANGHFDLSALTTISRQPLGADK